MIYPPCCICPPPVDLWGDSKVSDPLYLKAQELLNQQARYFIDENKVEFREFVLGANIGYRMKEPHAKLEWIKAEAFYK